MNRPRPDLHERSGGMSRRWSSSSDARCGGGDKRGPRVWSTGVVEERCRKQVEDPGAAARGQGRRRARHGIAGRSGGSELQEVWEAAKRSDS
jgi:hypothetical protein